MHLKLSFKCLLKFKGDKFVGEGASASPPPNEALTFMSAIVCILRPGFNTYVV